MSTLIELIDVTKEYQGQVVLRGIDLTIDKNEFVTFLGPSGCGKTTTLRIIGGFLEPSAGQVLLEGESVLGIPAHKRPFNTVFQRYALFPHLDVFENVAFGLRVKGANYELKQQIAEIQKQLKANIKANPTSAKTFKKAANDQIAILKKQFIPNATFKRNVNEKVRKYLHMVGLDGFGERKVSKLSGGQQQRVAIARALINEPKVLLLDEPLAALDLKLRQEMQYELKEIQRNAGITFIYVTHDQEEALTMSDKIVVMDNGEIQQIGTPTEIYNDPTNKFVASFIGDSVILPGIMIDDYLVEFDGQQFKCVDRGFGRNENVDIVFRPEDLDIVARGKGKIAGVVDSIIFKGVHYEIEVKTAHREFTVHTTDLVELHSEVDLDWHPEDVHVMEVWK